MIEALIVCTQLLGMQDCVVYQYITPMERTEENSQLLNDQCAGIVEKMLKEGFTVTCEEAVEVE